MSIFTDPVTTPLELLQHREHQLRNSAAMDRDRAASLRQRAIQADTEAAAQEREADQCLEAIATLRAAQDNTAGKEPVTT